MGIVPFPLCRRRKLVTSIAVVLSAKGGEEANQFWRETARGLLVELSHAGVSIADAQKEVRALLQLVLAEMCRGRSVAR
jgi:type IV secretory pathway TraG/TraD family ATPase VirD4